MVAIPIKQNNLAPNAITTDLVKVWPNNILLQTFFTSMLK
jgi:hypothetical protein